MITRTDFALSGQEFDFLWEHLNLGRMPYPVDVPSNGATVAERNRLRAQTFDGLRDRGLLRGDRPDPDLAALLQVVAEPTVCVDTVGFGDGPIRGLVASDGAIAAMAAFDGETLSLSAIRPTSLATSIVELLPPGEAGPGHAMSLPHKALQRAADGEDDDPFGDGDDRDILVANGVGYDDATTLVELAEGRVRGGQFGLTTVSRPSRVRAGARTRNPTVISWFDTAHGRYLMVYDGTWVSLAPADAGRIAHRIEELLRVAGK